MAATCVSNSGVGIILARFQTISTSWRAAWKTLTIRLSAIRSKKGSRLNPGASASMATAKPGAASWMTQSLGQNVVSRRNSVSTVTKALDAMSRQAASRSAVVEMSW